MVEAQNQTFPKTVREYFEDSYRFVSSGSKVLGCFQGTEENVAGKQIVVLDKTILHPQGGGQPSDEGYLSQGDIKFNIEQLMAKDDVIMHIGTFSPADSTFANDSEVECHVDEAKRRLYARIHSAGHLLDIAMREAGHPELKPSKGFHQPVGAYVEYVGNVEANEREALVALMNEKAAHIISSTPAEMPVFKKMCSYEEAGEQLANAGGVPSYIAEGTSLRVLKLTADDAGCPCGGTHVEHVQDIKEIQITKIQKKGKSIRVSYGVVPSS